MLPIYLAELDTQEEKDKFAELYEKYSRKMYNIALAILRNKEDAEDAVDITFHKLANNFTKISQNKIHNLDSYVVISIRNTSFSILDERRKKDSEINIDTNAPESYDSFSFEGADNDLLDFALSRLSDKSKDILSLYYYYGFKCNEIALQLGIKEDTARKRLEAARKALRKLMEEADDRDGE